MFSRVTRSSARLGLGLVIDWSIAYIVFVSARVAPVLRREDVVDPANLLVRKLPLADRSVPIEHVEWLRRLAVAVVPYQLDHLPVAGECHLYDLVHERLLDGYRIAVSVLCAQFRERLVNEHLELLGSAFRPSWATLIARQKLPSLWVPGVVSPFFSVF